jgi:hypothetical protein
MQSYNFCLRVLIALLLAGCLQSPVSAEESSANAPLKGGVVEIDVTLNDLRDARLSISRVRKATANLYDEVSRQQMTMTSNPNVVGTNVFMTPRVIAGPLLPARKKWVDESMHEIGPIIKLFKEDVDLAIEDNRRTDVSDKTRKTLDPLRDEAFELVKQSFEVYKTLENLTAGPNYNNAEISTATKNLDKQMKLLDKTFKKGISILQKEAKSSRRA